MARRCYRVRLTARGSHDWSTSVRAITQPPPACFSRSALRAGPESWSPQPGTTAMTRSGDTPAPPPGAAGGAGAGAGGVGGGRRRAVVDRPSALVVAAAARRRARLKVVEE